MLTETTTRRGPKAEAIRPASGDELRPDTVSFRCWEGQNTRIEAAALRENMPKSEWMVQALMAAADRSLGDRGPTFPPMRRRPFKSPEERLPPSDLVAMLRGLQAEVAELRAAAKSVPPPSNAHPLSEPGARRKAANKLRP